MVNKLNDAVFILDGLAGDLTGSVLLLKETRRNNFLENTSIQHKHIFRLCLTSIFMSCTKYVEYCDKYGKLINDEAPQLSKLQNKYKEEIKNRGIVAFRNDYIGHIHSKKMGRALSNIEAQEKLESCIGGKDSLPFLNWVYPDAAKLENRENYLVGVIELLHKALQVKL
jgi:hypothetical protein